MAAATAAALEAWKLIYITPERLVNTMEYGECDPLQSVREGKLQDCHEVAIGVYSIGVRRPGEKPWTVSSVSPCGSLSPFFCFLHNFFCASKKWFSEFSRWDSKSVLAAVEQFRRHDDPQKIISANCLLPAVPDLVLRAIKRSTRLSVRKTNPKGRRSN